MNLVTRALLALLAVLMPLNLCLADPPDAEQAAPASPPSAAAVAQGLRLIDSWRALVRSDGDYPILSEIASQAAVYEGATKFKDLKGRANDRGSFALGAFVGFQDMSLKSIQKWVALAQQIQNEGDRDKILEILAIAEAAVSLGGTGGEELFGPRYDAIFSTIRMIHLNVQSIIERVRMEIPADSRELATLLAAANNAPGTLTDELRAEIESGLQAQAELEQRIAANTAENEQVTAEAAELAARLDSLNSQIAAAEQELEAGRGQAQAAIESFAAKQQAAIQEVRDILAALAGGRAQWLPFVFPKGNGSLQWTAPFYEELNAFHVLRFKDVLIAMMDSVREEMKLPIGALFPNVDIRAEIENAEKFRGGVMWRRRGIKGELVLRVSIGLADQPKREFALPAVPFEFIFNRFRLGANEAVGAFIQGPLRLEVKAYAAALQSMNIGDRIAQLDSCFQALTAVGSSEGAVVSGATAAQ